MKRETRTVYYDEELQIEAYRFLGLKREFPNHFHKNYVLGFIEEGKRILSCRNQVREVHPGEIVIFHPKENHTCRQVGEETLDYRSLEISTEVMQKLVLEITGKEYLPGFMQNVICDETLSGYLKDTHQMIMDNSKEFEKEEKLLFLLSGLLEKYEKPFALDLPECGQEIERACTFIDRHYGEPISLDAICREACLSKSTLLRAFTRSRGITPYRYLETVRINKAKELLRQGAMPVEAALQTGFSDQSHFTRFFTMFTGVAPGAYGDIFDDTAKCLTQERISGSEVSTGVEKHEG